MFLTIATIVVILIAFIYVFLSRREPHIMPRPLFLGDRDEEREGFEGYPNTWYLLMSSHELKTNEVKAISLCEREIIIFRGYSGNVYALDAYCPHFGANIGIGGKVSQIENQDCISCPFHGWSFDGKSGKCIKIPNIEGGEIPKAAKIDTWPVLEQDQLIYVWYHSNQMKASFSPRELKETYLGFDFEQPLCLNTMIIPNSIKYLTENSFDLEHFKPVHAFETGFKLLPGILSATNRSLTIDESFDVYSHSSLTILQVYDVYMFGVHLAQMDNHMTFHMPSMIESVFTIKNVFLNTSILAMFAITPKRPMKTELTAYLFVKPTMVNWVLRGIIGNWVYYVIGQDCDVWANMKNLDQQMLTANDRSLVKCRNWAKKSFYT